MPLNPRDMGIIAVGVAFIAAIAYIARDKTNNIQDRYVSSTAGMFTGLSVIDKLDTGDHYFHPAYCVPGQTQIFLPHRYPDVSGGNISTLIHQGMDALRRPAPQDSDWIERPPAEVMF